MGQVVDRLLGAAAAGVVEKEKMDRDRERLRSGEQAAADFRLF